MFKKIRSISFFLITLYLPVIAYAVDVDPIEAINYQIKKGTCDSKVQWCPVNAERSNIGFTMHGKYEQPIRTLSIHYENLKMFCFLWKQFGGASNIWVTLEVKDPTGEQFVVARRCK